MDRQFTATVYIIENGRTLLIFHRKLLKWLPPGGHLDPNETPPEAAKREALEETGIEISFLTQENLIVNRWNAKSFERPYLCLIENIPEFKQTKAHQHIDFIYVGVPCGGTETFNDLETSELKWFTLDEIERLESDVDIFTETKETLRAIFATDFSLVPLPHPIAHK